VRLRELVHLVEREHLRVLVTFPQSWVAAAATLSAPIGMPKRTKARRPSALSMSASASRHTYTAPSSTK